MELKFLLGYVFEPTDQVLIEHYLLKRMTGEILSMAERNLVSECNLYSEEGLQEAFRRIQELEDEEENDEDDDNVRENSSDHFVPSPTFNKELFFFTPLRKKSHNGNRIDRSVGKGTWKGLDKGHPILDAQGRVIGMKKSFNYENKGSAQHLQWDMKEYSLDGICLQNPNIYKVTSFSSIRPYLPPLSLSLSLSLSHPLYMYMFIVCHLQTDCGFLLES